MKTPDRDGSVHSSPAESSFDGLGLTRRERIWVGLVVALAVAALAALVAAVWRPAPPSRVVMSTGPADGAYHAWALRYREILARQGVELVLLPSAGAVENLQRLRERQQGVTLALVQGGLADEEDRLRLVSLGAVAHEPLWIFHRQSLPVDGFWSFAGSKIAGGPPGSGTRHVTDLLLQRHGLTDARSPTVLPVSGLAAASALERGEVDMALLVAAPEAPAVQRLLRAPEIDLWHWRRAEAYARQMPVLGRLDLPEGAVDLVANLPARDLTLLSLKALLVTTPDIHPVLVDLLLDAAREVHGGSGLLHRAGDFPQPDATEYPMSADAERYHKSGPSALQRYLPYWAVVWIQRLIYFGLPLLVVGLPMTRVLPALYRWVMRRRVYRLYGELAFIEREGATDPSRRARALQRLAQIEQRVHRLRTPASFAAEAYMLRMHLDFVRGRLQALSRSAPGDAASGASSGS
jgi:TRAP-type uncharacterized transport system substrate-binding protein